MEKDGIIWTRCGGDRVLVFEIAAYIFFIVLIDFVSPRILWLVFLLFCYRFWEAILTYEFLSNYIDFANMRDYYIALVIVAVASYFLIMLATHNVPYLRYIFLLVMVLYTIKVHKFELSNIILFKDYLEAKGMWDIQYWINQFKDLLKLDIENFDKMAKDAWDKFWGVFKRFIDYVENL